MTTDNTAYLRKPAAPRRPTPPQCSQPKCRHGACIRMKSTGKLLCSLCARLIPDEDKEKA